MNDCANAEIRDRLPDLVHERLDAPARADVMAHVARCADCRAELEVVRAAHAIFASRTPRIDVGQIVRALPTPAQAQRQQAARHRSLVNWRVAASIAVLAVGGGSYAVITRGGTSVSPIDTMPVARTVDAPTVAAPGAAPALPPDTQQQQTGSPAPVARVAVATKSVGAEAETGLAMTGRLGDLSESQLEALLKDIDRMEAVPITEPEPVVLPVTPTRPGAPPSGQ